MGQNFHRFRGLHDICEIVFSAKFFLQDNISPIDLDASKISLYIHLIPSNNIAMKNVDKFTLGHSQR